LDAPEIVESLREKDVPHSQSLGRARRRVYAPIEIM
jgi:hypothetical protein